MLGGGSITDSSPVSASEGERAADNASPSLSATSPSPGSNQYSGQEESVAQIAPHERGDVNGYDVIPWALTAVGILLNLGWNYFNYKRMTAFQANVRSEGVKLEEFKRIRAPIDSALIDLRPLREGLNTLSCSGTTLKEIREEADLLQKTLTEKYLNLQGALEDADNSQFAQGNDWRPPIDDRWDELVGTFDVVHNPKRNDVDVRSALTLGADKIGEISRLVNERIDREISRYTNAVR